MLPRSDLGPRRRLVFPLAILLVAGGVWWWTQQRAEQQLGHLRIFLTSVITQIGERRDPIPELAATDPIIRHDLIAGILRLVVPGVAGEPPPRLTWEPTTGDSGPYSDGSASHTVVILRDGVERLGLRFQVGAADQPIRVIGVWTPDAGP